MTKDQVFSIVRGVVSDTFSCNPDTITSNTVAEDVDGWDSLRHTILMVRLQRAIGIDFPETVAAEAKSVGDLADRIFKLLPPDRS